MLQRAVSCIVVSAAIVLSWPVAAQRAAAEAAEQRELARQYARTSAQAAAEQAARTRELAQAREQLARTAGEIARLSSRLSEPTVRVLDARAPQRQVVLGLNMQDTDLGVLVNGVTPNGAAAAAGVTAGDTIVAINDVELARVAGSNGLPRSPSATLLAETARVTSGDDVELRILRDGDYRDLVVTDVGVRSPYFVYSTSPGYTNLNVWPVNRLGAWSDIELVSLTPALGEYFGIEEGLLVVRAGRAAELGLRDGDVIIDIGGREPQSPEHALRILATFEPGESLETSVMRQRRRQNLTFTVPTSRID